MRDKRASVYHGTIYLQTKPIVVLHGAIAPVSGDGSVGQDRLRNLDNVVGAAETVMKSISKIARPSRMCSTKTIGGNKREAAYLTLNEGIESC